MLPELAGAIAAGGLALVLIGCGSASTGTAPPPPNQTEPNNCKSTNITSPTQPAPAANYSGTGFTGKVQAGSIPIIGANVQLYAAGTGGDGSMPVALAAPVATNANGAFNVTSGFTCPFSNSILYIVARGGQAGAAGATNSGTVLTAMLGPCDNLKSSQTVTLDEATTVASVWAVAQFLSSGGQVGASATNNIGLALAAATAANLVDPQAGVAPGASFPGTGTAPSAKINTLANVLNACIVSTGSSSSACSDLYDAAKTANSIPSKTLDAAMNIAQQPGDNAQAIYNLSTGSTAYSPQLTAAPPDWTLFATYSKGGMNSPAAVSIDSQGNVWVTNYFYVASLFSNLGTPIFADGLTGNDLMNSYGGAVDVSDTMWVANEESAANVNSGLGSITLVTSNGNSPALYTSGGLNFPLAVAFDTSGVGWIVDYGNSHVTLLNASGAPLSGNAGYTSSDLIFPVAVATDSKCNAYLANQSGDTITRVLADGSDFTSFTTGRGGSGLAIDAADNVWVANYYANSVGLVSAEGQVLSGTGFTASSLDQPQGIAIDGNGNAWVASYHGPALTELAAAASADPGAILSPAAGWAPDAMLLEPYAVAIDAAGNIWVTNFGSDTLTEFVGLASPVRMPLLGPVRTP